MMDHKLLHDSTHMKVNVVDVQHFNAETWCCDTNTTRVNCFQKCVFNLNQINDGEDETELSIVKDDWGQVKAIVSFQDNLSNDNDVKCKVHTLE
jgi:hypothetical protein